MLPIAYILYRFSNISQEWAKRFTDEQKANHKQGTKLKRFVDVDVSVSLCCTERLRGR